MTTGKKQTISARGAYILFALGMLLSSALAMAAEVDQPANAGTLRSGSPADKYAATLDRAKKDSEMASAIVAQAQELLAGIRNGKAPLLTPNSAWGPAKYKQISRSFGWNVEVVDGVQLLVLSDVHQAVAWSFNRAILGQDTVYAWRGLGQGADSWPYGNFRNDWGNNIVFPFSWLDSQRREIQRLNSSKNAPLDLVGIPNNSNAVSRLNLVWFDWFGALATTHALLDMTKSQGGLENLLNNRLENLQLTGGKTRNEFMAVRKRCNETTETFAKRDCLGELDLAFADYGRKLIAGKQFMVHALTRDLNWNMQSQRLESGVMGLHGEFCDPNTVCEGIGPYGSGGLFLVCYRLDESLPNKLSFPMKEPEVRELSQRSGDLRDLQHIGYVIKITQDAKVNESPKMCSQGKNKILIEGRGVLTAKVLWNEVASQYAAYEKAASEVQSTAGSKTGASVPVAVPMMSTTGAAKESRSKAVIVIEAK
jgi:hypothetical protein